MEKQIFIYQNLGDGTVRVFSSKRELPIIVAEEVFEKGRTNELLNQFVEFMEYKEGDIVHEFTMENGEKLLFANNRR